jgi:hypothetical protein
LLSHLRVISLALPNSNPKAISLKYSTTLSLYAFSLGAIVSSSLEQDENNIPITKKINRFLFISFLSECHLGKYAVLIAGQRPTTT